MTSSDPDIASDERRARRLAAVRRRRRQRRAKRILGVALILTAAGAALFFATTGTEAIPANVRIGDVDVGGLSPDAAREKISGEVDTHLTRTIRLVRPGTSDAVLEVPAEEIASGADIDRAIGEATDARGRLGRAFSRVGLTSTKDIPLTFTLRDAGVDSVMKQASAAITEAPTAAAVRVSGDTVVTTEAQNGRRVDRALLRERLATLPETAEIPVSAIQAAPDDAEAERARALAERIRATPRDVTLDARTAPLTSRAQTNALRFPVAKGKITVTLNQNVLRSALVAGLGVKETKPKDARIAVDGTRARVIPSELGTSLDTADLARTIVQNPDRAAVTAKITRAAPAFTTKDAKALKIRDKVGEFTTEYACCQNRTVNIQIAARTINGTILKPGERFSLNDALGERTEAKGYLEAPMIAGEELVDSRGGGVSQVATTVYNAAFFSGMEIVTHTPHSFYISRYPKGREATISHPSPDLVFRNDWDAAVYIYAVAGDNAITVAMYSSTLGRRVETTTADSTNVVEPKTIERSNPSLEPGTRKVIQSAGSAGFTVSTTRRVYKGSTLHRDETFRWTYRPQNAIVEVGPALPATTAPENDTTTTGTSTSGTTTTP